MKDQDILLFFQRHKNSYLDFMDLVIIFKKQIMQYLGPYSKQKAHRCFRYMKNLQTIQYCIQFKVKHISSNPGNKKFGKSVLQISSLAEFAFFFKFFASR